MRKVLGIPVSMALGLSALMYVPAAAGPGTCETSVGPLMRERIAALGSPMAEPNTPIPWNNAPGTPETPGQAQKAVCGLGGN